MEERDGILGGYSLHILELPLGGGVFWVSSDLNSGKKDIVFHFWGRGVFWVSSDLNSGKKVRVFHFGGGVFRVRLDFDSGNNFNLGGGFCKPNSRTGVFWRILVKIFWKPSWLVHHI